MRKLRGIVCAIRYGSQGSNVYTVLCAKAINIRSDLELELLDRVEFELPKAQEDKYPLIGLGGISILGKGDRAEYEKALGRVAKKAPLSTIGPKKVLPKNIGGNMLCEMDAAAKLFVSTLISGAPISIRFHNDGDGAVCGIALHRMIERIIACSFVNRRSAIWHMQKGIAYDLNSFSEDCTAFSSHRSVEKPMVLVLDFGTCVDSERFVIEAGALFSIIWIDHHPKYEGFESYKSTICLNPWLFGSDSNVTAGMVACAFASSIRGVRVSDLVNASLISDHSTLANADDEEAKKVADVLDFVSGSKSGVPSHPSSGNITPKYLDAIISDSTMLKEAFEYSNSLLSDALATGIGCSRKYEGKEADVYLLDFEKITQKGFAGLLPGRFSSRLHDLLVIKNPGRRVLTLVAYGNGMSLRSGVMPDSGISVLELIAKVRKSCDYLTSGGGHEGAGSIRVERGKMDEVVTLILAEMGVSG